MKATKTISLAILALTLGFAPAQAEDAAPTEGLEIKAFPVTVTEKVSSPAAEAEDLMEEEMLPVAEAPVVPEAPKTPILSNNTPAVVSPAPAPVVSSGNAMNAVNLRGKDLYDEIARQTGEAAEPVSAAESIDETVTIAPQHAPAQPPAMPDTGEVPEEDITAAPPKLPGEKRDPVSPPAFKLQPYDDGSPGDRTAMPKEPMGLPEYQPQPKAEVNLHSPLRDARPLAEPPAMPVLEEEPPVAEAPEPRAVERVPAMPPQDRTFDVTASPAARWDAPQGADMREVLAMWSERAGVDFLWDTRERFNVPGSIAISGDYEKAVELLLGQYKEKGARPVATLYNDPQMNRRVLVVTAEGNG